MCPHNALNAIGSATRYRSKSVASVAQSWRMPRSRPILAPLDPADLDRFALRYVERFATTRGKLTDYLRRKVRERGWANPDQPADCEGVAQRMADLGYVDDRLYAEAKAGSMARRGLGARRVAEALRHAGVDAEDSRAIAPAIEESAEAAAMAFARRKRIGPFAREAGDRAQQQKHLAAMLRAGHSLDIARRITGASPDEDIDLY
ncbi:regulatory protein RecX [Sphingomonas sp. CJ20]